MRQTFFNIDDNAMDVETKFLQVTLILLAASCLVTTLGSVSSTPSKKQRKALQLSSVVTFIASCHYALMLVTPDKAAIFRYLDWFFTTPMLIYEFTLLHGPSRHFGVALVANFCMLASGWFGELGWMSRLISTLLGFSFFGVLAAFMPSGVWTSFFWWAWIMYGIVYAATSSPFVHTLGYTVLDAITKALFGGMIWYSSFV